MTNWMPRLVGLARGTSLPAGCATARSDGACSPVPAYSREFLVRAVERLLAGPAKYAALTAPPRGGVLNVRAGTEGWAPEGPNKRMPPAGRKNRKGRTR